MRKLPIFFALALAGAPLAACDDDESNGENGATDGTSGSGGSMEAGSGGQAQAGSGGSMEAGSGGQAQAGSAGGDGEPADIVETALAAGGFEQLAGALTRAGLVDALKAEGPFTVFAPTDEAFAAFEAANPGALESLTADELSAILRYHVLSGAAVRSSDLRDGQLATTLAGPVLAIDLAGDAPKVNAATVTMADIEAENGVIHVLDSILMPPGDIVAVASAADDFDTLAQALGDAGLVETLQGEGPFTVFAPTDAAFAALSALPTGDALGDVLTYHVLPGIVGPLDLVDGGVALTVNGAPVLFDLSDGAAINGAAITTTNVVASNGVIHVIDAVILPPEDDIVAAAVAAGDFTSLAGALTEAGLIETLQGDGPFTVFAPTDEAFAALSAVPTGDALGDVLLYHVVDGAIGSGDLSAGEAEMLSGGSVTVTLDDGVTINDARVTTANILTRNGVIHVIDQVLIPE
jgi:uncharacterized surface protein with fasciclin (FAS1) repeats